ncbi:MAG: recombinase family protein [Chloroflexota bacterium]|nr:recombinase family protein [Chloroflexota bacterium]
MATRTQTCPSAHPTRVAIYCRVSSAGQEDNSSLDTQEAACRACAAERGWVVVDVYREVHTGAELFERPRLTALREAMRRGEFDVLLVHALDRLSRKQTHQGLILSEAEHAGVKWESVTEDIDNSPQGQILRAVIGGMAEMERLKIAERTVRGRRARAHSGRLLPGKAALYGYQWRDATKSAYDIDPATAPIVQRIFRQSIEGTTIRAIAAQLTKDAVPTASGGTIWSASTIHTILKQPAYTGEATAWRYGSEKTKFGGYRIFVRPDAEQAKLPPGTVPQLVEPADFEAVQWRLQRNREQAVRNNPHPEATLLRGGYARCGYCGTALSVMTKQGLTFYRHGTRQRDRHGCPSIRIKADRLDGETWGRIAAILTQPEIIAAQVASLRAADPAAVDLVVIDRQIEGVKRKQSNLVKRLALIDDEDTAAVVAAEVNTLASQRKQLQVEREAVEARSAGWRATQDQLDSLEAWCRRVAVNLDELAYEEKRHLLDALGVQIRLYHTDHAPRFEVVASLPLDGEAAPVSTSSRRCDGPPTCLRPTAMSLACEPSTTTACR